MLRAVKIDAATQMRAAALRRRAATSAGSTGFADLLEQMAGDAGAAGDAAPAAPVAATSSLLALQAVDDESYNRRKAKARADELLDRLEDLRRQLLHGSVSLDRLHHLASTVRTQRPQVADPRLAEVLDDIDLRVQVELAKLAP